MEKKIIIFCATTALVLLAIVGLTMLFDIAFAPKAAVASTQIRQYRHSDFQDFETGRSADTFAEVQPVPEPATICMLGFGGVALLSQRKRKQNINRKAKRILKS